MNYVIYKFAQEIFSKIIYLIRNLLSRFLKLYDLFKLVFSVKQFNRLDGLLEYQNIF